jgi:hypothetical protein
LSNHSSGPTEKVARVFSTKPLATRAIELDSGSFVPLWALEVFDWLQICKRFFLAQLLYVSVNFQLYNCMTPTGFVKDSGETLQGPRGPHGAGLGQLRYGWNISMGADHFLSCPSAVVAHRSPLGVAGVPPSVATVRGTAGPEPLAMTPMVSEKDSCVVLPHSGQVKPQWTLEVDPGEYLIVATVGDRNVGFAAHLEVGGRPLFSGEWIEAGSFKSRCMLCAALHGAIVVGPHWPRLGTVRNEQNEMLPLPGDPVTCGDASGTIRHDSPRGAIRHESPPSPQAGSPRQARNETMVRGTRLVSLRVVAVPLAREVERERRSMFVDLNQKLVEARARAENLRKQAASQQTSFERELWRAESKLAELHVQKAFKLFSMIAVCKRVPYPYIYLNGEVSSTPPVDQLE